ncbi:MAG: MetQ/NlpA family ABC transporter substrate-binding protein [Sphaerochaeta sp.]|nr:MetQ/NlpA family ABC transporter substrate-binding protein [Sphaerochaeta sp.]
MIKNKKAVLCLLVSLSMLSSLFSSPTSEQAPMKIGIMPDADSLPFLLAQERSLFTEAGLAVELVPFQSPVERDAAFQAGRLDGFVGDTLGALFLEQAGFDISVTSITNGRYGLVASPAKNIKSIKDLGGKEIAVSSNTIIEYLASSLVLSAGVEREAFKTIAIPKIPVRLEMVLSSQISAACLPEPFYTLALNKGAIDLGNSTSLDDAPGLMIFSAKFVENHKDALLSFYQAYWEAAQMINADSDAYRDFLVASTGFPEAIRDVYQFVEYTKPSVPTEDQVSKVVSWMEDHDLLTNPPSYENLVDDSIIAGL